MAKYVSAVECAEKISEKFGIHLGDLVDVFAEIPAADVVPIPDVDETLEDLLVGFDEFGMQPTILVPDPEGMAIKWKRKLVYAIGRIKAEVAREIIAIIALRQHLVTQREEGVSEPWHKGYYSGKHLAYQDIKEIIEQKYLESEK